MSKTGPILIIEDDGDDKEILETILRGHGITNEIQWYDNAASAYVALCALTESPFLIFCDINLPGTDGLDFKHKIDETPELRRKSIPFLFFSTSATQDAINDAYTKMTVQGFFTKGNDYSEIKKQVKIILDYWMTCKHPDY